MNAEAERGLRRFLGAGGGKGGASRFGTDDLQGLLLQVSFAVMMVFMLAYFLFRADASREREEQLLELERQKLVVAADAVRAARRARYGLSVLLPDGAGEGEDGPAPFDPALVLRDGRLVEVPGLRAAFADGLSAAAADFADPLRLRRAWIADVLSEAGLDPAALAPENARWLDVRADADLAAAAAAAREVGRGTAAALQRRWMERPEEIGDPAVAAILERFQAADEAGRLLLVTDLSDALRARSLTVVSELAGSRGVGTFLAESGTPAGEEPSP